MAIYGQLSASLPESVEEAAPGVVLGQCRLMEKIAEGGMGVVWMAEQLAPVHRTVALKIMKAGMDSAEFLRRFGVELESLSRLEHPNIARIYDAGITPRGRPFLVMELVRGAVSVTDWCRRENVSLRARLELFTSICEAVQHAHSRGIIHRDLKPSNLLVTADGGATRPVVIDFGIARALNTDMSATLATETGRVLGTPAYMSPEQASAGTGAADTRADVYALGCVLYELLTGSPPFDHERIRTSSMAELVRILQEEDPPPPSARLRRSGQSGSALRGELDCIVMRALEKDPERRYRTAAALEDDMQRYLRGETVHARPSSLTYRLRKLVARHKPATAAISVGVLAAAVIGAMALRQWQKEKREQEERRAAEELATESERRGDEKTALSVTISAAHAFLSSGQEHDAMLRFIEAGRLSQHLSMPEAADRFRTEAWRLSRQLGLPVEGPWLPRSHPVQRPGNSHWYQRIELPMTWTDAEAACRALGGHLATVDSAEENRWVHGWFAQTYVCWLGAQRGDDGQWQWITGEPFTWTNWAGGEPSDTSGEEKYLNFGSSRLTFFRKDDTWNDHRNTGDNSGWWLTYPLCEWEPPAVPPARPAPVARAAELPRSSLRTFGGHWYARINESITWEEAEAVCVALGGHLACINSEAENTFVFDQFATDRYCWLGATDAGHEGEWRWLTGEPFRFMAWATGEPSNSLVGEHYLITGQDAWNDARGFTRQWNDMPVQGDWAGRMITSPVCEWDHLPTLR